MNPVRIVVVEDHTMIRQLLSDTVRTEPDMQIVASVGTVSAGITACLELTSPTGPLLTGCCRTARDSCW